MIYVYGYEDGKKHQYFYQDDENDMMVALLSANDEFDYFGYMKKMMLTLHNVRKINKKQLPIHGAMVQITLQSGETKNIVVMGDMELVSLKQSNKLKFMEQLISEI